MNNKLSFKKVVTLFSAVILSLAGLFCLFKVQLRCDEYSQAVLATGCNEKLTENISATYSAFDELEANYIAMQKLWAHCISEAAKYEDAQQVIEKAAGICETDMLFITDSEGIITASVDRSLIGKPAASIVEEYDAAAYDQFDYYFYTNEEDEGKTIYYGLPYSAVESDMAYMGGVGSIYDDYLPNGSYFAFSCTKEGEEGVLSYYNHNGKNHSGERLSDVGLSTEILQDGYSGLAIIDGREYQLSTRKQESVLMGTTYVITADEEFSLFPVIRDSVSRTGSIKSVLWVGIVLITFSVLLALYACFLEGKCEKKRLLVKKLFAVAVLAIVLILFISVYTQTLDTLADSIQLADYNIEALDTRFEVCDAINEYVHELFDGQSRMSAEMIALLLDANPEALHQGEEMEYRREQDGLRVPVTNADGEVIRAYANCPVLRELQELIAGDAIYVFNQDGYAIASSNDNWYASLSEGTDLFPDCKALLNVVDGVTRTYTEDKGSSIVSAVPFINGIVVYESDHEARDLCSDTFTRMVVEAASAAVGGELTINPNSEDSFSGSENMFVTKNGTKVFVHSRTFGDDGNIIRVERPTDKLFDAVLPVIAASVIVAAVVFAMLIVIAAVQAKTGSAEPKVIKTNVYDYKKWHELTPEKKLSASFSICLLILVILIFYQLIMAIVNPDRSSVIGYILLGDWKRGLNLFSISACIIAVFIAVSIQLVVRYVLRLLSSGMEEDTRAKVGFASTIFSILAFAVALLFSLYFLGLDVKGLFASAGIMAAVLGYASKDVIGNLTSGVAVMYSDDYRIGEYVDINGFYGQVKMISLSKVIVENNSGDRRIFKNNRIYSVINKSRNKSTLSVALPVGIDNDEKTLCDLVEDNLSVLEEATGCLTAPIVFNGLGGINVELTGHFRNLLFSITCQEKDAETAKNRFLSALSELLLENDISV